MELPLLARAAPMPTLLRSAVCAACPQLVWLSRLISQLRDRAKVKQQPSKGMECRVWVQINHVGSFIGVEALKDSISVRQSDQGASSFRKFIGWDVQALLTFCIACSDYLQTCFLQPVVDAHEWWQNNELLPSKWFNWKYDSLRMIWNHRK